MWERFVLQDSMDVRVAEFIQQSWLRSKSYKVNPHQKTGKVYPHKRNKSLQVHANLIYHSESLMKDLYELVKGSDFTVILCDRNGIILKQIGDETTLSYAKEIQFVEGADWSEEAVGTNAIGTCIFEKRPLQIFAHEHYSKICQQWTCSASPILSEDGEVLGVLNMSGPSDKVHPHTLGMVVSAVKAIENKIRLQEKMNNLELMKGYLEATTNTLNSGIMILNNEGRIIKINDKLQHIIGLTENEWVGKKSEELFTNRLFEDIHLSDKKVDDVEIRIKLKAYSKEINVFLTKRPIIKNGKRIGSLILFEEVNKVHKFVNKVTGNRAKVTFNDIIGNNKLLTARIQEAKLASQSVSNVLLLGESGTGKDLFAQAIHNHSNRKDKPFIAINCGAIPKDLLGSELFGYADGAFTGAKRGGNSGKFELADGGTIFLDEIGEMPLDMQVLLLRLLENRELVRIGGSKAIHVDVRIISATNKDLYEEVQKGSFREDLFFRLNVLPIKIPPLRERKDDIELLTNHFVSEINHKLFKKIETISPDFIRALREYEWPGNVRELHNITERMVSKSQGNKLEQLPTELVEPLTKNLSFPSSEILPKKNHVKKLTLINTIKQCNYNYSKAAKKLGISRSTLYRQLDRFGLKS
ncbi:sigma-54-dependent Fis family transcriptional regulator [Aquibacillus sp. 3ASR75-11]|uniref:Sigma-54-dependent Fis family transcriptional regulator n=2 Tax=Terrihalobacillus insolitus TaxID=2950438 RepID=A0A9X3WQ94_9BACI|nr:sigma-54-dependent Fis family transcriptional regulator [Terrihalobacillus insolitus]MDC3412067.1 sigma-54-dependent Fis family transcriptional regulator [Terrihalobacillus insolitus]MDC3423240.1 sigma-54-dependent Fis family transcriptional regulator [Terrihalobacillus insolitus]